MTRVTITLETPLAEALRAEARREDRAVSSVARRAFARYFTAAARAGSSLAGGEDAAALGAGECPAPELKHPAADLARSGAGGDANADAGAGQSQGAACGAVAATAVQQVEAVTPGTPGGARPLAVVARKTAAARPQGGGRRARGVPGLPARKGGVR